VALRLDRYTLATFLLSALICAATCLCLFVLVDCFQHLEDFSKAARELGQPLVRIILRYYAHQAPLLGYFLAPVVACGAAAATVTKLLRENEIVVLKSSGISLYRVGLPILAGAALLGALMAADQELIIPRVASSIDENAQASLARSDESGEVWDIFRVDRYRRAFQIQKYDRRAHRMEHLTITVVDDRGVKRRVLYADHATWDRDPQGVPLIVLSQGIDYSYPEGDPFGAVPSHFGERGLTLQTNLSETVLLERDVNPILLNSRDLKAHLESIPPEKRTRVGGRLLTSLNARVPECLAPLFLALLAVPLVLWQDTRKYAWGLALGFLAWVLYMGLSQICILLGGVVLFAWVPVVAAWAPLAVVALPGVWLYLRIRT
jgi:lipopolysaccharide export LptBFGC system permease protein LptF